LVYIVDDDDAFRAATARLLRLHGYETREYASADQFLGQIGGHSETGCILLDVSLPGLSGPELQRRLVDEGSPFPIVFLTGHGDIPMTVSAIKSGAEDFLTKPVPSEILLGSIDRAIARHETARLQQQRLHKARTMLGSLTPRERQVFEFMVQGHMNKRIAGALGIAERTVKAHRHKIFEKFKAQSIADLVSLAERLEIQSGQKDRDIS
jgi:FixJ family two-component response regulator